MTMTPKTCFFLLLFALGSVLHAQDDGRIIFRDPKSAGDKPLSEEDLKPRNNAWGMDLMVGADGFGIGTFYHKVFSDILTGTLSFSITEAQDSRQKDFYGYYGETISYNKLNRVFRLPLFVGIQYRMFKDVIAENFRPFLNAGAGPVFLYVTPYHQDFFRYLDRGHMEYSYGGFVGVGAQFGYDRSAVFGVNLRYYIIPLPSGIQSVREGTMSNANGFYITVNFGSGF